MDVIRKTGKQEGLRSFFSCLPAFLILMFHAAHVRRLKCCVKRRKKGGGK